MILPLLSGWDLMNSGVISSIARHLEGLGGNVRSPSGTTRKRVNSTPQNISTSRAGKLPDAGTQRNAIHAVWIFPM